MKKCTMIAVVVAAMLCFNSAQAQIDGKYYGEKEDFKEMSKRALLVELMEEDKEVIEYFTKKESRADELAKYKALVANYNAMIKATIPKYWAFNSRVEYKTASQVVALQKAKSKEYTVLTYIDQSDREAQHITVPAFMLSRIERPNHKPDYKLCIPSGERGMEADFKVALLGMQSHIKWVIQNDKTPQFQDYAEKVSENNCSRLAKLDLVAESNQLSEKLSQQDAQAAYGASITWSTPAELNKYMVEGTKGKAALFAIPYGIYKQPQGMIINCYRAYYKVIVDCETGDILWTNNPGSTGLGKNVTRQLVEKEFKNMKQCKL